MRRIEKQVADRYFRIRTTLTIIYLVVGFSVSFLVVFFARELSNITINGFPFHYFMGAQGAVLTFILLLSLNAIISDKIDEKFGINHETNEKISAGKTLDH